MPRRVTSDEIRDWCIDHIARTFERRAADIDPDDRFARLGLDSATLMNLIVAAEEWLGIEVDPESVYEYRTINALSFYVAACLGGPAAADGQP